MVQTWSTIYTESFPYIRVLIHLDYWYLIKDSNAGSFSCFLIISATKSLTLHMNKLENPFLKIFCAKFGWNRSGGFVEVGSIYKSTDRQMGTQTDGLTDNDRLKDKKISLFLSFSYLPLVRLTTCWTWSFISLINSAGGIPCSHAGQWRSIPQNMLCPRILILHFRKR